MAAVSINKLLNKKLLLFAFIFFVSIVFSFLWVIINQIRVSIKGREWGEEEEEKHKDVEVVESVIEDQAKGDESLVEKTSCIEIK